MITNETSWPYKRKRQICLLLILGYKVMMVIGNKSFKEITFCSEQLLTLSKTDGTCIIFAAKAQHHNTTLHRNIHDGDNDFHRTFC